VRRRKFITLLGGVAVAWPLAARAQQGERMRRVGVLSSLPELDTETLLAARCSRRRCKPWAGPWDATCGSTTAGPTPSPPSLRKFAAILVSGNSAIAPMLQAAGTTPIVFAQVIDPVGSGFVESMARPGGNVTGFTQFE
jgi:putative ABC transport system substrate-binding protein